ncbi:MAG TPA: Uma2 family endonuclease [Candidatus Obscuribacterales bacterium]
MIAQLTKRTYSPEEYLALEAQAEYRSEYRDGEIIPMAGGTTNHNEIVTNLCVMLKPPLRARGYRLFTENVRVWIERYRVYTYPDVMAIAGEPVYYGAGTSTVTNPSLIVEVASKSTKNYDQGDKFDYYRSLPSFQEYILVEQYRWRVLQHLRQDNGQWLLSDYEESGDVVLLASLDLPLPLSEIYAGVDFGRSEADIEERIEGQS